MKSNKVAEYKRRNKRKDVNRPWLTALKSGLKELKLFNFIMLAIAGCINAFGVTVFLFPVKLYDSGISGLSMLLDQVTPSFLTLSLFLLILNIPIFIFGLSRQGAAFTVYSIFTVGIYSVASFMIMNVLPIDVSFISPLAGSDLLLCAVFGGLISGIGSGMTIRYGGAIDGIDVLSVVFAKHIGISLGTFNMVFNAALYIVCGIVINSWILPLYSIVTYYVGSKTVDYIVEGFDRSKCAMIVTTKADAISDALSETFGVSGTIVNAMGGYSKERKQIVYFIINHFQINKLKRVVHDIDGAAFISLQEVSDIIKISEPQ
ncbi:MAG: YitT family protein [Clostridia bacterium]|nr:YitT family protein [Clostridia bacterium]